MKIILPTAYFPNLESFYFLYKNSEIIIGTNELFPKQTYRNRCTILNANGKQDLTVPVERDSKTITYQAKISYAEDWLKNHLRSIESAYKRSPYYEYYIDGIEKILSKKHELLVDLNFELLEFLVDKIGLTCELKLNNEASPDINLNEMVNPKSISNFKSANYIQTFSDRFKFENNLSILDLLFNEGPNSISILQESFLAE